MMVMIQTPLIALVPIAALCCTVARWLANDLAHSHTPRFNDFLGIPLFGSLKRSRNRGGWRAAALEIATVIGVMWLGFANKPENFAIGLILFLYCLISVAIDLEHLVVPDKLTIPCVGVGLVASYFYPSWQGAATPLAALLSSFLGALLGAGIIMAIIELGKLAYGKQKRDLDPPEQFRFEYDKEGNHSIIANNEAMKWEDIFNRKSDRLMISCKNLAVGFPAQSGNELAINWKSIQIDDGETQEIDEHTEFSGLATRLVIPREAMGYGDAQFMCVIGAFAGVRGIMTVAFAGIMIGAIIGIIQKTAGKGNTMPFVPPLALGVLSWALFADKLRPIIFGR